MKKILPLILVALAAACGGSNSSSVAQNAPAALPSSATTQMGAPSNGPAHSRAPPSGNNEGATGAAQVTNWGLATWYLAVSINGGSASVLDLIQAIVALQPTSCAGNSCTWEGSSTGDPVNHRLVVTEDTSGSTPVFSYSLDGAAKSDPTNTFLTEVSGTAKPSGIPHRGTGSFTVNFDNALKLDPSGNSTGKMSVTYDNTAVGSAVLHADFTGATSQNPNDAVNGHPGIMNSRYSFAEDGHGGGDLDVGVLNTLNSYVFEVHTRWLAGGAGRAHVSVFNTATPATRYTELECWDSGAINIDYLEDQPGNGPSIGAESSCAIVADPGAGTNTPPSN